MKIFFKHLGGQCELENVEPFDTVSLIKRRLSEMSKMTESEFFIVTENDELLEDDYMLEDYEIENEEPDDIVSLIKRRLSELDYEMKMKRYGESRSGVQNLTKNL